MAGSICREDLVDLTHSPRHTRRGFLRGDSAPKFYPVANKLSASHSAALDFRPPASDSPLLNGGVQAAFPSPPHLSALSTSHDDLDFTPEDRERVLSAIEESLSVPNGNAFLSWLAEQLEGKVGDDYDPYLEFGDEGLFAVEESDEEFVEAGCEFESAYADIAEEVCDQWRKQSHCFRPEPRVEISADGWRLEVFDVGSKIVKDVLGRVVEVRSQFGDCLYFRYGLHGYMESVERVRGNGATHSNGQRDKHGVVVRDPEGRVRAAGETMSVDPRGCFYLHTFDGQFFSVDLVTGIHTERRKVMDDNGASRFVTSLFTHDGFRMATMFSATKRGTEYGASAHSRFRFYGRDGTLIEFASEDDLQQLRPNKVLRPASRPVSRDFPHKRQATTAWDAVYEYLMRVS